MAAYLAMRIEKRKLNYNTIVAKFSEFKDEIDQILAADGYIVEEDGWAKKPE